MPAITCAQKAPLHLWLFFLFIPTGCGNQLGIQGQSLGLCQWGESQPKLTQTLKESQSLNILFASCPFSSLVEYLQSFFSEMLSLSSFDLFTSAPFLLCSTARDPFWCLILIWLPTVIWFFGIMKRLLTLLLKVNQTQHGGFYLSWIAASYLQAVLRATAMLPFRNTGESHYLGLFQQLTLFHLVNKN